jgi:hypothetical protein
MQLKDGLCLNRSYFCKNKKIFSTIGHSPWNKGLPGWNKGTHLSEEHKKKLREASKRQKISIEGIVFNSFTEAAKYYNVRVSTISCWVKTKKGHPSSSKSHPAWNKGTHLSGEHKKN